MFATVARAGEKELREIPFLREQTEAGAALTIPMAAHESCFVVFSPEFAEAQQALELPAHPRRLPLENWTLEIPERKLTFQMEKLRSWEQLPGLSDFSGEGVYRTRFTLEQVPDCAEICLSQLSCACTVWVNGVHAGDIWTHPLRCRVESLLRKGENTLEIRAASTLVNECAPATRTAGAIMTPFCRNGRTMARSSTTSEGAHEYPSGARRADPTAAQRRGGARCGWKIDWIKMARTEAL